MILTTIIATILVCIPVGVVKKRNRYSIQNNQSSNVFGETRRPMFAIKSVSFPICFHTNSSTNKYPNRSEVIPQSDDFTFFSCLLLYQDALAQLYFQFASHIVVLDLNSNNAITSCKIYTRSFFHYHFLPSIVKNKIVDQRKSETISCNFTVLLKLN